MFLRLMFYVKPLLKVNIYPTAKPVVWSSLSLILRVFTEIGVDHHNSLTAGDDIVIVKFWSFTTLPFKGQGRVYP